MAAAGYIPSSELAVYDPSGQVYMTYPTDYLQHSCTDPVSNWTNINAQASILCNYRAVHLTTENFASKFPDSVVGSVISTASSQCECTSKLTCIVLVLVGRQCRPVLICLG